MSELLKMRGVTVELPTAAGWVRPVNGVSLALMGLLPTGARTTKELLAAVPEISRAGQV